MNICHVITRCIVGGAQENTLATVLGLARRGHRLTLITGPSRGPEGCLLDLLGAQQRALFTLIEEPQLVRAPQPWRDAAAYMRLRRHFLAARYDVIHSHSSKAGVLVRLAARAARRRLATSVVHTIHGLAFDALQPWYRNALYIALERRCAQHTDLLVSVCHAMTQQALAAGVGCAAQFCTVYSGMDLAAFRAAPAHRADTRARLGWHGDEIVLLHIGRLAPMKGADVFLAALAAARARTPRVRGIIIGDGPQRAMLERRAAHSLPPGTVHWTGLLPPHEIAHWLAAADVLVHASLREGLARAVVQALAAGVPVAAYEAGGVREVAVHDRNSRICALGDQQALIRDVELLAADDALRARLTAGARATPLDEFSTDTMVDHIAACYTTLRHAVHDEGGGGASEVR